MFAQSTAAQPEDLNPLSSIEQWIEVKRPYYALHDLQIRDSGWLSASVPVECEVGHEHTLMDSAEVGRHLAILGSCAGALENPQKSQHYYLAHQAEMRSKPAFILAEGRGRPKQLKARARASFLNKRALLAETEVYSETDELLATLSVHYHVMKEKSFSRIYANHEGPGIVPGSPLVPALENPYAKRFHLDVLDSNERFMRTSLGVVTREMCVGHFDKVRALPVAILSQCFINSSLSLLVEKSAQANPRYVTKSCSLSADVLATAGQAVTIEVELLDHAGACFVTHCIGRNQDGVVVGEARFELQQL